MRSQYIIISHSNDSHLLHRVPQPHDLCRLTAGLSLGGEQHDLQVGYIREFRVDLLIRVHKVLDLSHGELSVSSGSLCPTV